MSMRDWIEKERKDKSASVPACVINRIINSGYVGGPLLGDESMKVKRKGDWGLDMLSLIISKLSIGDV